MRFVVAIGCWLLELALAMILGGFVFSDPLYIRILGVTTWALLMRSTVGFFLVSVPEYTGLVTVDVFTGRLKSYLTGMHFRFPWEQVKEGNYINLRLEPMDREEDYPSKDGPKMHVKWQVQFQIVDAVTFMRVGLEAIEEFLTAVGSGLLSSTIARKNAEVCKRQQPKIEKALQERLEGLAVTNDYGVEVTKVALADLDYDKESQKVRTTQYVARKVKKIGEELREGQEEGVRPKDALNSAMIIHGDVTKHVNEVEGEGGEALAALLMAMSQGGGGRREGGGGGKR